MAAQPEATPPDERVDRLTRYLADALEQQSATSQVLETIGRSDFELRPVFETVVRHAIRLCAADGGYVHQLEGDVYRLEVALGGRPEHRRYLEQHPIPQGPGTLVGRVALEKRTVQISDAAADPKYEWHRAQQLGGFRTLLGVPMLAEGRVVGVVAVWRSRVEPFDDREIGLVTTFAAQGLIAIQNVRLFRELEQRSREQARSVDELRALGEVSQAVSLSLDLDEVLNTIVTRAVELSGADGGSIFEYEPSTAEFVLRTCFGTSAELAEALTSIRIRVGETFIGRAAIAGEAAQAEDLDREPPDLHIEELRRHGWRSLVTVPLRREQEIIGALTVRSKVPGALPKPTVALLETLASQSTVAINNARVFRELEDKTRQLEVASRHKSEFLASMSHELRTPLNSVIGFSDVLLDRMFGELNERQAEYVGDIRDSGRHLLELINEILDLSKVEAGRMELELAAVSLPDLLAQGVAMVRERADRHGISVSLEVAADLGSILGDELKLRQVVLNLLSNAVKFTPDRGSVVVTAGLVDGNAKVSVRDTGIGIAESERERIFEAFQRGGREARSNKEGTGLGLTLSRQIVGLHGGRLWMDSELGVGSTFTFAIPVGIPSPPGVDRPLKATTPVPDGGSSAGSVLVVEDDRRSADLMRVYLDGAGYTVSITGDGLEGLELVRRLSPRAVILDILLPGLSGWDLLTRLKADPATAAIPVVIASMLDERGAGFALGASEYLVKPIDREALLEALGRCVAPPKGVRTVVVIDDDPLDLELVEAVLAPVGWSVLRARGGEEGVELVRRERPSVVLLDLLMPDVDGFEVIERLRADPTVADVPIVVLTSKEITPADHERLAGRISFLAQKGTFQPAELVDLVGRVASAPTVPSNEPS
ncbi:GAF domain-containing protein [Solirubrobacter ginsenosidimutans]|uniref:histidine kinase n=1 Tax=Solirubrobacter ginsenosidimutans TaxID=490573 RepID=A0A9X3MLH3_9ACTN|nr:GAF domain-containing protein [Solirubrobacter ginsenosidimutans]MDA0158766.1 GAF domain-containing protein [Solirubrobacter ginsenosidimutans]